MPGLAVQRKHLSVSLSAHVSDYFQNMRSSVRIAEITSGQAPQSEQQADLQNFAISLSDQVEGLLGHQVKEEFLNTSSNVAPLFLRSQIASQDVGGFHDAAWRQQAELAVRHAGTLSGSLAILTGQEPADLQSQECLTTGSLLSQLVIRFCRKSMCGLAPKACLLQM